MHFGGFMKKLFSFSFIALLILVLFSCNDNSSVSDPNIERGNNNGILQKILLDNPCGNNQYPPIGNTQSWDIEWCLDDPITYTYTRDETCRIWSWEVSSPTGVIELDYECDYDPSYASPKATTILRGTRNGFYATIIWKFVWCDYYVVERKVDNGNWSEIVSLQNDEGDAPLSYTDYYYYVTDSISYRIKTRIAGTVENSNVKTFYVQ